MKTILLTHAGWYPKMEPRDAVKLLYQSEFSGGHLIRDEAACLRYLRQEYEATPQQPTTPLLEEIGSGIVRVNLTALDHHGYSPEALGRDFIRSAAAVQGSFQAFQNKLTLLTELTEDGLMPFSPEELKDYLEKYAAEGYPPVSHSEAYRAAYHPAYRVVHADFLPDQLKKHRTP